MAEIAVSNLNKFFGENHVLRDITFDIFSGERVGLIGANGSGKTTLFKILTGRLEKDSGDVYINPSAKTGLLEQLPEYPPELTVRDVLMSAFSDIFETEREMHEIEQNMSPELMDRYSKLTARFETLGGYEYNTRYNIMTNGLDIPPDMQEREFMSLSGGEKTRVNLARIMLSGTDILLLDEPTNHLDLESITWLEEYLKSYRGTVVIISHDRYFLDAVTTRTLELEEGSLTSFPGNYSYYVDRKEEIREQLELEKKRRDKEIARLEFTVDRMKGWGLGNKKVMKRAFAMEKRLQRMERIETMRKTAKMKNRFTQADGSGDEVYNINNLTFGYDAENPLARNFTAQVLRGERIALLGVNGCGKTTLLKTILGILKPISGVTLEGVNVKTGYLPQVVSFSHPERNLVDTLLYETNCSTQSARDRLASFGFKGEEVFKTPAVLSGGEKTRLKLCLFMSDSVNTLFLDEPTNHLDLMSREWLEESVDDFSETMIFVSHDRYFINRFATRVWYMENGTISDYPGNYDEFLKRREIEKLRLLAMENSPTPPKAKAKEEKEKKTHAGTNAKVSEKKRRERRKKIKATEKAIADIDAQIEENPEDYVLLAQLVEEKDGLEEELLMLYEEDEEENA